MRFEGPEKKVEIICSDSFPQDLRELNSSFWEGVVKACNADILSKIHGTHFDAYLLSESSLFVGSKQLIMITCGKTKLLNSLPEILKAIPVTSINHFFYERKRFMFPDIQQSDFEQDVAFLTKLLPGKSYRLGAANNDHMHLFYAANENSPSQDITVEILMSELDSECLKSFDGNHHDRSSCGIRPLLGLLGDKEQVDDYFFEPLGYSINAINNERYWTVHVTPEDHQSYVSFETNLFHQDYTSLVKRVTGMVNPRQFMVFFTKSKDVEACFQPPKGYNQLESCKYSFEKGYNAEYYLFCRD